MNIILTKDVKKQGKKGDILTVKDGYGKFLIQSGSAVLKTETSKNILDKENKERELKEKKLIEECTKLKKELEKLTLIFKVKTGKDDRVFGSISSKQIIESLKDKGYNISKKQVNMESINSLGFHNVEVFLHKKVSAKIKVKLEK